MSINPNFNNVKGWSDSNDTSTPRGQKFDIMNLILGMFYLEGEWGATWGDFSIVEDLPTGSNVANPLLLGRTVVRFNLTNSELRLFSYTSVGWKHINFI